VGHMSCLALASGACKNDASHCGAQDTFWTTSIDNFPIRAKSRARPSQSAISPNRIFAYRQFFSRSTILKPSIVHPQPGAIVRQRDECRDYEDLDTRIRRMLQLQMGTDVGFITRIRMEEISQSQHKAPFVIKINYQLVGAFFHKATVHIADHLEYKRRDMGLKKVCDGSRPCNWIATIPLCFRDHPTVHVIVNGQHNVHNVDTGFFEYHEVQGADDFCMCVTFHDTAATQRYRAKTTTTQELIESLQKQSARLENLLNKSYELVVPQQKT